MPLVFWKGAVMSRQTLGKTLLRNVIRHTDAHNKIQEEIEMWKMRDWETQTSHSKHLSDTDCVRGRTHCNRVPDQPRELSRGRERVSEHDDREARYWTRKLYEFEAKDTDRWGHSGFKELYPEEFESDGEKNSDTKKSRKMKKSKDDTDMSLSKRSKKSSRKKKKKKKKKDEEEKRKKAESSSSSDDSSSARDKKKRKSDKSRHKNKKTKGRDEDSNSGNGNDEEERERRAHRRKKRKPDSRKDSDSGPNSKKKRRKNWRAAGEESSHDSSGD